MIIILSNKEQYDALMQYSTYLVMQAYFIAYYDSNKEKYIAVKNRYTGDHIEFDSYSQLLDYLGEKVETSVDRA